MREENTIEIPDYSHLERTGVPEEFKWNVTDAYAGIDEWEEDKTQLLKMIDAIDEMEKNWTASPAKMFTLLNHLDEVEMKEYRLYVYAGLLVDTDMGNSRFQSIKGEIQTIDVNLSSRLTFVNPGILKLGQAKIREYMEADPRLRIYEITFDNVLRMKKHILPSDKEGIVAQTGLFSGAPGKAAGMLNDLDIPSPAVTLSDGKKIRLNTAAYSRHRGSKNAEDRRKVMRTFWKHRAGFRNTHAVLLDAAIKNHFFNARVHRYKNCLDAALYPKNIHPDVYHTLVRTVKENLGPLHRYLKLKARLLGLIKMNYDDIYASCVPDVDKIYTMEEAKNILIEAMRPLGSDYIDVLSRGLNGGWMDIYPNKGKRSGAYSNGSIYNVHPYVLMNYNGKFSHVSTLAHEFGHALHSWYSNKMQPFPLSHYSIFLAEIASTFNENLLVEYMVKTETDNLVKLYILDQHLEGIRGTLYRQALFADFELAMHREVEKGKTLTHDWLNENYLRLTRLFYGHNEEVVTVDDYIKNEWLGIPHFYYNFYVYQYSTGIVASTALAEMVLSGGESERLRYLGLLKAGGSRYPLDTLKEAGVDLTTSEPIEIAIARFDETVARMESLADTVNEAGDSGR